MNLNLARKWRSKQFDQIIGQDLSVRMLKNSLYVGHYFPVYLFSGQRGCGKTTTARVFAAAINCEQLSSFQKDPKNNPVPCLTCGSCTAMIAGKHPDFIEIDAASHTGVDNVRQIIDAATLLPLMGRKKIYLIDEAHMQSKAAFNAFLKILEEPPQSVLFILATTDPEKIIDTVKSRCFQLFFRSVEANILLSHLVNVCQKEEIRYDEAGLHLIIKETEGSVRDALNVLEQVRFSSSIVSKNAVLNVLGHVDDERLLTLFDSVLHKGPKSLLQLLHDMKFELHSAEFVWRKLTEFVRASIWLKHGVDPMQCFEHAETLKAMTKTTTWEQLSNFLEMLYSSEKLFTKTTAQHALLEMILLQMCQNNSDEGTPSGNPAQVSQSSEGDEEFVSEDEEEEYEEDDEEEEEEEDEFSASWAGFLQKIDALRDPLLNSVFKQGKPLQRKDGSLDVEFSKELSLFQDVLEETKKTWQLLLSESFGGSLKLNPLFTGASKPLKKIKLNPVPAVMAQPAARPAQQRPAPQQRYQPNQQNARRNSGYGRTKQAPVSLGARLDVSDAQQWKKAEMVLQYFPGVAYEMQEVMQ